MSPFGALRDVGRSGFRLVGGSVFKCDIATSDWNCSTAVSSVYSLLLIAGEVQKAVSLTGKEGVIWLVYQNSSL